MIEIGDYRLKHYEYGYELHIPYEGYTKSGQNRLPCVKHRPTYWPNLISACTALLRYESGKSKSVAEVLPKFDEWGEKITAAVKESGFCSE